ncbi:MAG TPA: hypothetical protein VFE53_08345, partial [Mucilaginibacter sp.]|nr:hypothetical protein [Mucilaginibacter sp.]
QMDSLNSILSNYLGADVEVPRDFMNSTKNPIISKYFIETQTLSANPNFQKTIAGAISATGGLDVTNIANGIADLMIDRAKQELTIAFFNRFKKFSIDNPEFQILFPKTTTNLTNLLEYSYPQMLPALRTSFLDDLGKITNNLGDVLLLPRYQSLLKNFPEITIAIKSLSLIQEIESKASNAADIIKEFAAFDEWTAPASSDLIKNMGCAVKVASLFSESIRVDANSGNSENVWVSAADLKQLFSNADVFQLYLGLLYQQAKVNKITYWVKNPQPSGTPATVAKPFADLLVAQNNNLLIFQNKLKEFFDLAAKVNTAFGSIATKQTVGQSPTNDDFYNYVNVSLDVVDYSLSIIKVFDNDVPISESYISILRKSNSLYKDVYTKQYTQTVTDVFDIFTILDNLTNSSIDLPTLKSSTSVANYSGTAKDDVAKLAAGNTFLSPVTNQNIDAVMNLHSTDANIVQLSEYYNLKRLLDFTNKLKPYALFIANVVEAKNSDDIKAALDDVILPVGSSSIKKNSCFNFSVQSYLGAYLNGFGTPKNMLNSTWADKFGVTAPIGLSVSTGLGKGGSISLFGSLFDLGAIVDYQLAKDSVTNGKNTTSTISKNYKVNIGQIFSPGAYVVYGMAWNIPLAIGLGGQYGPGLSKINTLGTSSANGSTVAVVNNPEWRWNIFLSVDLPFFTLSNKTRNNKTVN